MRKRRAIAIRSTTSALCILALACTGSDASRDDAMGTRPSIEGSYRLASRDLPDGTTIGPPQVFGFMTFTDGIRHFHIYMPGADGGVSTFSHVAEYELSDATYRQRTLYEVANDPSVGGLSYSQAAQTLTSPVTLGSGTVQFQEVGGGPTLVFTDMGMTATLEGQFVDRWDKIE